MRHRSFPSITLLALSVGCTSTPPARNADPHPSTAAQAALHELYALEFDDTASRYGGGKLIVTGFAVSPDGTGPVVLLERDGITHYLPVETDGDVADLFLRVLGQPHETITGELSDAYRAATR